MKPAPFRYFAPQTLEEALDLLARYGDEAKVLAGGQSLIPMMNFRLLTPAVLIDLNTVQSLFYIRPEGEGLAIGAMTRQRRLEDTPLVAERAPLLQEAIPFVAHPQIRNRGTVGGSLAHADPAAELPAVVIALNARLKAQSKEGERWIAATDFFQELFTTALEPQELLTEIVIPPLPPRTGWAFSEVTRRHGDYALTGVAATVTLDATGCCTDARLVLLSVGAVPVHARQAVNPLIGELPTAERIRAVAEAVDAEIDPPEDIHASAAYRRGLARVLSQRTLSRAVERAQRE
ncbi:MAG: xanthine dehydrogenase family protein subunit M [Nitrospinota bacterium]|nr:MAG: xanthine dehydrogenase family protein subunit M [Nitrospinota bacterium]